MGIKGEKRNESIFSSWLVKMNKNYETSYNKGKIDKKIETKKIFRLNDKINLYKIKFYFSKIRLIGKKITQNHYSNDFCTPLSYKRTPKFVLYYLKLLTSQTLKRCKF